MILSFFSNSILASSAVCPIADLIDLEIGTIGNSDGLADAFDHVRRSGGVSWHLLHPLAMARCLIGFRWLPSYPHQGARESRHQMPYSLLFPTSWMTG